MKFINIVGAYQSNEYTFLDNAKADAAYAALKAALQNYREFGNRDDDKTVSFGDDNGEITIRLGAVVSVGICDADTVVPTVVAREMWKHGCLSEVAAAKAKDEHASGAVASETSA